MAGGELGSQLIHQRVFESIVGKGAPAANELYTCSPTSFLRLGDFDDTYFEALELMFLVWEKFQN